jgi:hypothetical protein
MSERTDFIFTWTYPIYVLKLPDGPAPLATVVGEDGMTRLLIFTDTDLVKRFAQSIGARGVPFAIPTDAAFVGILQACEEAGYPDVVVDLARLHQTARVLPVKRMLHGPPPTDEEMRLYSYDAPDAADGPQEPEGDQ